MNVPRPPNGKLAQWVLYVAVAGALGLGGANVVAPVRVDAYTRTDAKARAALVDERFGVLQAQVEKLVEVVSEHVVSPMHPGAATAFAELRVEMRHVRETLEWIKRRLQER